MRILLFVLLLILIIGALPVWPYSTGPAGFGYGPSSILGLLLVILIVMAVLGRI